MIASKENALQGTHTPSSLHGFGDAIHVGDWVHVRYMRPYGILQHRFFRVEYIRLSIRDPLIVLSNHLVTIFGWYHQPGRSHVAWLTFKKLGSEFSVPAYLRGKLLLDPVEMTHARQLSKQDLLDVFSGQEEAHLSVVVRRPEAPWLQCELLPVTFSWRRTGNRPRLTLLRLAPTYSLPDGPAWIVSEQKIQPNGMVYLPGQHLAFFACEGQGILLRDVLRQGKL